MLSGRGGNSLFSSRDAVTWTAGTNVFTNGARSVVTNGSVFVAVGGGASTIV